MGPVLELSKVLEGSSAGVTNRGSQPHVDLRNPLLGSHDVCHISKFITKF